MEVFDFYQDAKMTIWYRTQVSVKANSLEEAKAIMEKYKDEDIEFVANNEESDKMEVIGGEFMGETSEFLPVEENGGYSTFETYTSKGEIVCSNAQIY